MKQTSKAVNLSPALAEVQHLSAGFEQQVVVRRVDFAIPSVGAVALLGPAGVGKSTLLRTLGRWNDLRPSFWVHGKVLCHGRDLLREEERETVHHRFALMQQKARLFTANVMENAIAGVRGDKALSALDKLDLAEQVLSDWGLWERLRDSLSSPVTSLSLAEQRMLSLARLASQNAECLLVDEPLRDIDERARHELLEFLVKVKSRLALVFTTHNLRVAETLSDQVVLLADGTQVEVTATDEFFKEPKTDLGRRFRRTGNCWPMEHEKDPEWVAHQQAQQHPSSLPPANTNQRQPSWAPTASEVVRRPGGFHWLEPGLLGGTQWPGLLQDERDDLCGLVGLGVQHLINLTEKPFENAKLIQHGISGTHFPIVDMGVPNLEDCEILCRRVMAWVAQGQPTVFHCRAGLGRTGTLLACMRVMSGDDAVQAIERVRRVNHMYIQSQEQLDFIELFASFISAKR